MWTVKWIKNCQKGISVCFPRNKDAPMVRAANFTKAKSILKLYLFALVLGGSNWAFAAGDVTTPINFGGGVDYSKPCTDIADNAACDAQNMIGDLQGAASKRYGGERFIAQAISSHPINSQFWLSIDQGTVAYKALIATTWDRIYKSTGGVLPQWTLLKKNLVGWDQHFSFAVARGKLIMTGDQLTDPPYSYDIVRDSFTELVTVYAGSDSFRLRAKYVIAANNQVIFGNVLDVSDLNGNTTYYGSRIFYSFLNQISSYTLNHQINIRSEDGESLTGMTYSNGKIYAYKDSGVSEISYSNALQATFEGGNIAVQTIVNGFGCIAPRSLQNIGQYDAFLSKGGLIFWDRNQRNSLDLVETLKPFSTNIRTVIESIVKNNTYQNAHLTYYPKKQWLVFGYEDPFKFPQGRSNSVSVYDIRTGQWWPFSGWLAESFVARDAKGDDGVLLYGDSIDGYVYQADLETRIDDARKELVIDNMESMANWTGGTIDNSRVVEGTASIKLTMSALNNFSTSTTRQGMISLGEWADKSKSSTDDKIAFKMHISSHANVKYLRIDLQVGVTVQAFDQFTTSVTISSADFVASSGSWAFVEVPISSFPIPSSWTDATLQESPFAANITYYGLRFVSSATNTTEINIDDVRLVQSAENPIESYFLTKQFNLGQVNNKDYRQVILTRDKTADSSFSIDVFTNFGDFANKLNVNAKIPKEIFVLGYKGTNGITRLNSFDFSVINSTRYPTGNIRDYMTAEADAKYIYAFDKVRYSLNKLDRSSMSVIVSSFGSLGTGTTNFETASEMTLVGTPLNSIFITDPFNHRIVQLKRDGLKYVNSYGELGNGTTNLITPCGITADLTNIWIADDDGFRIVKLNISTYGFVSEKDIDSNTFSDMVLRNDARYLYAAYNKVTDNPLFQDVILEKRNKGDMSLIQRKILRPRNVLTKSTYTLSGDFALLGPYIFIGFTKDVATTGTYYVQKLLKSNFDIIDEYTTTGTQFSVVGDGEAYLPSIEQEKINLNSRDGTYLQLKYYDYTRANTFKLFNYAFALDVKPYEE